MGAYGTAYNMTIKVSADITCGDIWHHESLSIFWPCHWIPHIPSCQCDESHAFVLLRISQWKMQKKPNLNYHFSCIVTLKIHFLTLLVLWHILLNLSVTTDYIASLWVKIDGLNPLWTELGPFAFTFSEPPNFTSTSPNVPSKTNPNSAESI